MAASYPQICEMQGAIAGWSRPVPVADAERVKMQVKQTARKAKRSAWQWSKTLLIVWAAQLAVLFYVLVTQTWSTYWFCRDLYRPGYSLFAAIGRGILPDSFFNLFSTTGVLASFAFAALLYAAIAIVGVGMARQIARR